MKKVLSVILSVAIMFSCITLASAALRGDVDGNKSVNSADAL